MAEKPTGDKPAGAESPTTARPLDFDDEPQESAVLSPTENTMATPKKNVSFQEDSAPPKPPRPMSPQAQAEANLVEMFPSIDPKVVKAVLVASGGKMEPASNALLSMSDPDFKQEEEDLPPAPPPRPTAQQRQLEADERYARQLAAHYQAASGYEGYGSRQRGDPPLSGQRRQSGLKPNELYDDQERSFIDDDLPEIRDNIKKGFLETQTKVNKWFSDFRKRIDGEDEDEIVRPGGSSQQQSFGSPNRGYADTTRRSGDRERYDADPREIGDDFSALELRDNDPAPPPRPPRPAANPDLFKPTPTGPPSGPVDEVDALYSQPSSGRQPSPGSAGKTKKWQPLTSVAPNPEADEHDPFSLGDDDDEEEAKTKDLKAEDSERLKSAAAETTVTSPTKDEQPKPAERSGSMATRDKEAEAILTSPNKP